MTDQTIDRELLLSILHYDPETGLFTWINCKGKREANGARAGSISTKGYRRISIQRKRYAAHRLAWLYMTGSWPKGEIDHINGVRDDNRWVNLRDVPLIFNAHNKTMRPNRCGHQGVYITQSKRQWMARIYVNRKAIHLGAFDNPIAAQAAYLKAKEEMHRGFVPDRFAAMQQQSEGE